MVLESDVFDDVRKSLKELLNDLNTQFYELINIDDDSENDSKFCNEYEERIRSICNLRDQKLKNIRNSIGKIDAAMLLNSQIKALIQQEHDLNKENLNNIIENIGNELNDEIKRYYVKIDDEDLEKINDIFEEKFTKSEIVTNTKKVEELEKIFIDNFKELAVLKDELKIIIVQAKCKFQNSLELVEKYEKLNINLNPNAFMAKYYNNGLMKCIQKYQNDIENSKECSNDEYQKILNKFQEEINNNPLVICCADIEEEIKKFSIEELLNKYKEFDWYIEKQKFITSIQTLVKKKSELEINIDRLEILEETLKKVAENPDLEILKKEKVKLEKVMLDLDSKIAKIDVAQERKKIETIKKGIEIESGVSISDFTGGNNKLGTVKFKNLGDDIKIEDFKLEENLVDFQKHNLEDRDYTDKLVQKIFEKLYTDNPKKIMEKAREIKEKNGSNIPARLSSKVFHIPKVLKKIRYSVKEFLFPTDPIKAKKVCEEIVKNDILNTLKCFKNAYWKLMTSTELIDAQEKVKYEAKLKNEIVETQIRIDKIKKEIRNILQTDC